MSNHEYLADPVEVDLRNDLGEQIGTEDAMLSFMVGYGIPLAVMAYGKLIDSSGGKQYSAALNHFKAAQRTNFTYGLDNAISINDSKRVQDFLKAHAEGKFKALFKSVETMIEDRTIKLNLKNDVDSIAAFIAEDIKRYPELRPVFNFKIEAPLVNTNDPVNYDKLISLLDEMIYDSKYGPWNALTKGWERTKDRIENLYKILTSTLTGATVKNTFDIHYNSKTISNLSMIEAKFSDGSFLKRKNKQLDSFFIKLMPHFSKDAREAKKTIAKFYSDVAEIYKEIIHSNKVISNTALGNINKYQEEIIKLTKSKDFKIR